MNVVEGTRTIKTFRGSDPEKRTVYWSLTPGEDAEVFSIGSAGGALTFNASPDYEEPQDTGGNNTYTVMVTASDDAPGAGDTTDDPIMMSSVTVTVKVANKVEKGTVTFNKKLPVVGIPITAELGNSDNTGTAEYAWYNSASSTEPILESGEVYTPDTDDVGGILTVKATYEDDDGDEVVVSARTITVRAVRTDPPNTVPMFLPTTVTKIGVREDIAIGTRVGSRFNATDADSTDRSYLTYGIAASDVFAIDRSSGQLSTKALLNYEGTPPLDVERGTRGYTVVVTAMDPHNGDSEGLEVTINVTDVNERPKITSGVTRVKKAEYKSGDEEATYGKEVDSYEATDPDIAALSTCVAVSCEWSLRGTDAKHFEMGKDADYGKVLFKELPNYEKLVDSGRNNVYEMTGQVSDGTLTAMRKLEVTVTDVAEVGVVTLSSVHAPKLRSS